MMFFLVRTYKR